MNKKNNELFAKLAFLVKEQKKFVQKKLVKFNFTPNEIELLMELEENRNCTEISKKLDVSKALVSRSCHSLYEKGFIYIEENKTDRRAKDVYLTKQGEELIEKIIVSKEKFLKKCFKDFDENEIVMFNAIVSVCYKNLK